MRSTIQLKACASFLVDLALMLLHEYRDYRNLYVTVYRKTGHNAACVNIEKRSIDFLKMYCFKPTGGNG